jgi:hypothetical protein
VRVGVITNMKAGRRGASAAAVVSWLRRKHPEVPSVVTTSGDSVPGALAELADQGVNVLVVNGGDGTLSRTLTEVLGTDVFTDRPILVPLRTGRTNSTAVDLGTSANGARAMARLLRCVGEGTLGERLVHRSVLRVAIEPDDIVHYGMVCAPGIVYRGHELAHSKFPTGKAQGAFGSLLVTLWLLSQVIAGRAGEVAAPDRIAVTLDGLRQAESMYTAVIVSTLERFFAGLSPFWGRGEGPVRFTSVAAATRLRPAHAWRIMRGLPPTAQGADAGYHSANLREVELELSCGIAIDGEMYPPRPDRRLAIRAVENVAFARV